MNNSSVKRKLTECKKTREIASDACLSAFQSSLVIEPAVTETAFKKKWKSFFNKFPQIDRGGGWYDPPPEGIAVLFGTEEHKERVEFPTLRPQTYWPGDRGQLTAETYGYVFASPYTWVEGVPIVGDFGFTFYLGSSVKIRDHFKKCWEIVHRVFESVKAGMTYREIHHLSSNMLSKHQLANTVQSTTDPAGENFGHSLPFIEKAPTEEEKAIFKSQDRKEIHKSISLRRRFLSGRENSIVSDNCAFSFEPRMADLTNQRIPMCSYHTIIQFSEGKSHLLTDFSEIFKNIGMNWMEEKLV